MHHIKLTQPGWGTFSDFFGPVEFKNGVSVEPVPRITSDRILAQLSGVLVDADGKEFVSTPSERLVAGATIRMETVAALPVMTAAEHKAEQKEIEEAGKKAVFDHIYTEAELAQIASVDGIKGLRAAVGDRLGVRDRSIPGLIAEILKAQEKHLKSLAERDLEIRARREDAERQSLADLNEAEKAASAQMRLLSDEPAPKTESETPVVVIAPAPGPAGDAKQEVTSVPETEDAAKDSDAPSEETSASTGKSEEPAPDESEEPAPGKSEG